MLKSLSFLTTTAVDHQPHSPTDRHHKHKSAGNVSKEVGCGCLHSPSNDVTLHQAGPRVKDDRLHGGADNDVWGCMGLHGGVYGYLPHAPPAYQDLPCRVASEFPPHTTSSPACSFCAAKISTSLHKREVCLLKAHIPKIQSTNIMRIFTPTSCHA